MQLWLKPANASSCARIATRRRIIRNWRFMLFSEYLAVPPGRKLRDEQGVNSGKPVRGNRATMAILSQAGERS